MFSPNPQPAKPGDTGFTIRRTERTLEIHPPGPEFKRPFRGEVPIALLSLLAVGVVLVVVRWIQLLPSAWVSRSWWVFLLPLGFGLLGIVTLLDQNQIRAKTTHLYCDARQGRFRIVQRSLKSHKEKIIAEGVITEIQNITASLHAQGRYGAYRSIIIHARQPFFINWRLTPEEAFWIIHEIQFWLRSQQETSP